MTIPPPSPRQSPLEALFARPYLLLILTTMFWGGNVVAGKAAVGHIDPYALMILRWTGALLAVLPFALGPVRRDWPVLREKWWLLFFYGALGYALFNVLVYGAAYFTSGVNTALDQVAVNIFVMLLNFAIFRIRVRALQLVGVALTILGVAITATHGELGRILELDVNFGDLLVIIASFGYAVYSLTLRFRPATNWLSFLVFTFTGAIIASLFFQLVLGGGFAAFVAALPTITPTGWGIALYTMIFPSILSQMFYVRGIELIGTNRASLFVNLIPFFGALGSVLVLGESLEPFHIAAGALILTGIVLAEWAAQKK